MKVGINGGNGGVFISQIGWIMSMAQMVNVVCFLGQIFLYFNLF